MKHALNAKTTMPSLAVWKKTGFCFSQLSVTYPHYSLTAWFAFGILPLLVLSQHLHITES